MKTTALILIQLGLMMVSLTALGAHDEDEGGCTVAVIQPILNPKFYKKHEYKVTSAAHKQAQETADLGDGNSLRIDFDYDACEGPQVKDFHFFRTVSTKPDQTALSDIQWLRGVIKNLKFTPASLSDSRVEEFTIFLSPLKEAKYYYICNDHPQKGHPSRDIECGELVGGMVLEVNHLESAAGKPKQTEFVLRERVTI